MLITKRSKFTGAVNRMDLPVTREDLLRLDNEYVQDVFPNLTVEEREFLISGASVEEQEAIFGEDI